MAVQLGALADTIFDKNVEIAKANAALEKLQGEKRDIENKLLGAMQEAGTDIVRGTKATVSISTTERYQIADADKLFPFLLRKKALHLFERRLSAAACRELEETLRDKQIPGVSKYQQARLNVRKV